MNSLDHYMSEVASPFDEIEADQTDIDIKQYNRYQRDVLINSIAKKNGKQYYDLFFDEYLEHIRETGDVLLFLGDCLKKLNGIYHLDVTIDYIDRTQILENDQDMIVSFIKFFVYDDWLVLAELVEPIDPSIVDDQLKLATHIKESYSGVVNKIMIKDNIHPLVLFHFANCAVTDGLKTLGVLMFKDIVGVITRQLKLTQ